MSSALITGANRGLGFEFARQYLANGWNVYAACRDPDSASELRDWRTRAATNCSSAPWMSLSSRASKAAAAELDGTAIDLLLNNAGVMGARAQTIRNIDYTAWAKVLDANTLGPMRASEALSTMWRAASASLSSLLPAAWDRLPTILWRSIAYRSSKAAVNMVGAVGDRSRSAQHHLRGRQSRLGAD